ncbi:MAG: LEA type 2 family protein [Halobacteriota archaeon]
MKRSSLIAISIIVIIIILSAMSLGTIKKPTVDVSDIALRDVSLTGTTIDVGLVIDNTNPIGATLDKITYDVYLVNGEEILIAHGEKEEKIPVSANDQTTVIIPTEVSNIGIIKAIYQSISGEERPKLKVAGSVSLNLKLFSIDVPFEETRAV